MGFVDVLFAQDTRKSLLFNSLIKIDMGCGRREALLFHYSNLLRNKGVEPPILQTSDGYSPESGTGALTNTWRSLLMKRQRRNCV